MRRSLLAAADWVAAGRDDLNRLNVFPVPDGDTGTNLCLTLRAVADALRGLGDAPLPQVTAAMADASVRGARGNSGMMLAQFLLGLHEELRRHARARVPDLARAMAQGFERLRDALDDPVEGTLLTVVREAAEEAARAAAEPDLRVFLRRVVLRTEAALAHTPDLLAVLKAAGVVDAGAKGFVRLLDGIQRLIEQGAAAQGAVDRPTADAASVAHVSQERDFQFCTEVLVRAATFPPGASVRGALRSLGDSIVVLEAGDLLKAHVHTNTPERVFALAATWGTVESTRAQDVRAQHRALTRKRPIVFVADTACDLPDVLVVEHGIGLVPTQLVLEDHTYRDRLELAAPEFFARLRAGLDVTTSQPAAGEFEDAYADALRVGEHVIVVALSSRLSGTHAGAAAAARRVDPSGRAITVLDSRSVSLGEGLLVLRGVALAARGVALADIVRDLSEVRDRSGGFFTVDGFERLLRSGRVGRLTAWLGSRLNIRPILGISHEGALAPVARTRGRAAARRRLLDELDRALAARPGAVQLGIAHADLPDFAAELAEELAARYHPTACVVAPITPVIAAHAGLGAWGVFYQVADGTNAPRARYD